MKNREVVNNFVNGEVGNGSNLYSIREDENTVLYSYSTIIAVRIEGLIFVNSKKYSNTTSKHKYYLPKDVFYVESHEISRFSTLVYLLNKAENFLNHELVQLKILITKKRKGTKVYASIENKIENSTNKLTLIQKIRKE